MGRLVITDKPKPRLEVVEPRTRRRITPEEIEKGLGAERVASVPPGGSPMSAFALRQELFHRLRSTGGRPGLDGADMKPKIPMRRSKWKKLEQLAKQVENDGFHPTPAQLASVILDAGTDQFEQAIHLSEAEIERHDYEIEEESEQVTTKAGEPPVNNEASGAVEPEKAEAKPVRPPWLRASAADLMDLDFEAPIAQSTTADSGELSEQFQTAIQPADKMAQPPDTAANRVFIMLSAVTGMHFKPQERHEPFGPMITFPDGRRSAIPSDFRGAHIDLLGEMARRAKNPVLRARLADVCWLLDRKRGDLGNLAVAAYVEIVQKADSGELKFRFQKELGALQYNVRDYLRRALQIGRAIGWDKPETIAAQEVVILLQKRAIEMRALVPVLWFCELDLDSRVSNPAEVAAGIDEMLRALPDGANSHVVMDLWRLAGLGYHFAKKDDDKYRCQTEAAERLVSDAEAAHAGPHSALLAAHTLSAAIAQLHGVPGKKDRRLELRHRLIDIQARIPEEMPAFRQELNLQEVGEEIEKVVGRGGLIDKLFIFAGLSRSPEPEELVKNAVEAICEHPLSSIFATSHLDHEGKVIHRTEGAGFGDDANYSAVRQQIAQSESIRRRIVAFGQVEVARQTIISQHFLSDDIFVWLLRHSPFVPPDLLATFCRGFLRFFEGDFVSATYILTPLLENSLRHVLKDRGHDVTIFDDATQTQEDRTISSLFEQMRTELDEVFTKAITTDIENVFLSKPGPHLRHSLAHGLLHDGAPYGPDAIYGCGLMFKLCLLPLFPYRERLHLPFV